MTDPVVVGVLHALPHAVRSQVDFLAWKRVSVEHEATAMLVEVGSVAAVLVDTGLRRQEVFQTPVEIDHMAQGVLTGFPP